MEKLNSFLSNRFQGKSKIFEQFKYFETGQHRRKIRNK